MENSLIWFGVSDYFSVSGTPLNMKAGLTVETVTRSRKVVSTREHLVMARQLEMECPDTPPIYSTY